MSVDSIAVELAGNQPLMLDDPALAWVVREGRAYVFAMQTSGGQPVGSRHPLFTVESGGVLLGARPPAGVPVALMATGATGTLLDPLDTEAFWQRVLSSSDFHAAAALEQWIDSATEAACEGLPPRGASLLPISGPAELADGEDVQSAGGTAWLKIESGVALFEALALHPLHGAAGYFPLSALSWMRAVGPTQITVLSTRELPTADDAASGLERLHDLAMTSFGLKIEAARNTYAQDLERKAEVDRQALRHGASDLLSAYEPAPHSESHLAASRDPLLAAARLVGHVLGVDIRPPPPSEVEHRRVDPLGSIARSSRVRVRPVTLNGDWWRRDNGALLAYRREGGAPVALLPKSASSYELVDPVDESRQAVARVLAASLAPEAHAFYRPFPDRRMGLLDLLRFGIQGAEKDLASVAIMGVFGGLIGLIAPVVMGLLVDEVIPDSNHGQLLQISLGLVASSFGVAAFYLTRGIAYLRVEGKLNGSIQAAIWDRLLSLPVPFFRDYLAGDLALRAMGIDMIRKTFTGVVVSAVLTVVFSLFSYVLLFVYDWVLALVATALLAIAVGVTVVVNQRQLRYLRAANHATGRVIGLVLQLLTGIAKLRVGAAEDRAFGVWAHEFSAQTALTRKAHLLGVGLNVFTAAFPLLSLMIIFSVAAQLRAGELSTGAFLAFNAALGQVIVALLALVGATSLALAAVPHYEGARPILDALPEVGDAMADPGELEGDLEVNGITFRYQPGGPPVLQDVSFRAGAGEFIALAGPSGAGKSTLLRLLLGFEHPEGGSISYDGQDLAGLDLRAVRRQVGVVLQSGKLMPGDIYTNIVGATRLPIEAAWEAARMAEVDEDIRAMPMGMFTMIMEGIGTLSGGQRQRLLIARAIVNRPRILLFDEATSALDNETQAVVSRSLEGLRSTRVVIAHRLSTIMKADRIYVLDGGRIVQTGSYADLMEQGGPFAELAKRQLA